VSAFFRLAGLIACLFTAAAFGQTPGFRIAGRLIRRADRNPIRNARVFVFPNEHPDRLISCATDENGNFQFSGLTAGKYYLGAEYRGWTQAYKQLDEYSTAIAVGPGLDGEHVLFPLESPARIAGSVFDDTGDPVSGALVYLLHRRVHDGSYRTVLESTSATLSDGTFRLAHLAPGTYYVAIAGRPWYAQNQIPQPASSDEQPPPPAPELDVAFPLTYYAGSLSPSGATPLQLDGGTRAEIQLTLHAVPAVRVTFDGNEKDPNRQIWGNLAQIGPGGTVLNAPFMITNAGMGGMAPGEYAVDVRSGPPEHPTIFGSQTVRLTGNSTMHLSEGAVTSITGKVIFEGDVPQNLALLLENAVNGDRVFIPVTPDHSLGAMPEIRAGRYSLRLANSPDLFMKSVSVRNAPFADGVLELRSGSKAELTIHAARGLSKMNGMVVRDGKPIEGAMVLLVPESFEHGNYIPRDQSDSDGTFTLNSAAPGRYTLIAIEDGRELEYANPAAMAPYLRGGERLDVPMRSAAPIKVEVQVRK
jgi:hypothetical protein